MENDFSVRRPWGRGYAGRVVVTEFLKLNDKLVQGILEKVPENHLQQLAVDNGMIPLIGDALRYLAKGEVSIQSINESVPTMEVSAEWRTILERLGYRK